METQTDSSEEETTEWMNNKKSLVGKNYKMDE
jgi:hypothetical protein